VAADTDVEVDDEPELFLARSRLRQRGHRDPFLLRKLARENSRIRGKIPAKNQIRVRLSPIRFFLSMAYAI
jgi:hypothetical protein